MSKQSEAKLQQGYRKESDTCGNCIHYSSEMVPKEYKAYNGLQVWTEEKNKRFTIGEFAVGKGHTCNFHSPK